MQSSDSSINQRRVNSSSEAKKDNSTIGAKSRMNQSLLTSSEDRSMSSIHSSVDRSEGPPRYVNASSSAERKKMHSHHLESPSDKNKKKNLGSMGLKSAKLFSRTSSIRSVGILVRKTSFKPKRASLNYPKVSEDVAFDKATYTSTVKDSKFQKAIKIHDGGNELENTSRLEVCRYHHCSLHGHFHGGHDEPAPTPQPKHFLFDKRRSFNKKKRVTPKTESRKGDRESHKRNENLEKSLMNPGIKLLESDVDYSAEIYAKHDSQTLGGRYEDVQDLGLIEVAFGETSFPERAYQENLEIMTKYEKYFGGMTFGLKGYCLRCLRGILDEDNNGIPENEKADAFDTVSSTFVQDQSRELVGLYIDSNRAMSSEDGATVQGGPQRPLLFDEVAKKSRMTSSTSDAQISSYNSSDDQGDEKICSVPGEDLKVVEDSETRPTYVGRQLQFSKPGHISMWNLIHQHMSSNLAAEPQNDLSERSDGENSGPDALSVNQTPGSSKDLSDSDVGTSNDSEAQDIEVRKLMAIKLVREAIEKILLPEVQDLASNIQPIMNESTYESDQIKENQNEENNGGTDADKCEAKVQFNPTGQRSISNDTAGEGMNDSDVVIVGQSETEKKAPKRWSNLKKWILLKKFIRELEEVKKFNLRKPWILSLYPEPEAGKVSLRHQTLDGRKNSDEWMLDYALRQAVSQLAPTQKRKVALLVKAFETVVPPQEDPQVQFRTIPRFKDNENEARKVGEFVSEGEKGKTEEEGPIGGTILLGAGNGQVILDLKNQETGSELANETAELFVSDDNSGESLVKSQSSSDGPKEENVGEAVHDHPGSRGVYKNTNAVLNDFDYDSLPLHAQAESENVVNIPENVEDTPENVENIPENVEDTPENVEDTPENVGLDGVDASTENTGLNNIQTESNSHIKMWHMIYQHVVSGIAERVGSELLEGSEDDEVEDETLSSGKSSNYSADSSLVVGSIEKNRVSRNLRSGLTKSYVVELIREAIDEILLPQILDDSSDAQSVTNKPIFDKDTSEAISSEGGLSAREIIISTKEEVKPEYEISESHKLGRPKNWIKLKQLILLQKSIKALEETRKHERVSHQLSPQFPDAEPEKVDLRRQLTDERKKAEEWMLDYAVQHIVTKLTPSRKRRVSMLVEAFEAVVPFPEI